MEEKEEAHGHRHWDLQSGIVCRAYFSLIKDRHLFYKRQIELEQKEEEE
jgi:hypothetical protein